MHSKKKTEAFNSINQKLSQLPKIGTQRSIYRVHKELRDVNNNAYEPKLISIGPYHRGKDNLKMMEEHKLRYLQLLLESRKHNVERYISAIEELEQKARDCYAEPISLNRSQFVEMLVLDGCFIIELVRKFFNEDSTLENDPLFQMGWMDNHLRRDLFLFENQIPFFVLCELFDLIEGQNKDDLMEGQNKDQTLIYYLLSYCRAWCVFPTESKMMSIRSSRGIKHLLDLVYKSWLSSTDDIFVYIEGESPPLLSDGGLISIPSVTELKNANMEFQKNERGTWFEVKFENGIMKMPPLKFQDSTESFLRNLVVYEQYFLIGERNLVTDYVIFLDFLINSSKDVEILSGCEIIDNCVGDSEVAANIINRLGTSIVCHGKHCIYANMLHGVNSYYKKRWNRWMAMLRKDIFYSPWAYLSFFAALAILVLTIIQTVCSILQVV